MNGVIECRSALNQRGAFLLIVVVVHGNNPITFLQQLVLEGTFSLHFDAVAVLSTLLSWVTFISI